VRGALRQLILAEPSRLGVVVYLLLRCSNNFLHCKPKFD